MTKSEVLELLREELYISIDKEHNFGGGVTIKVELKLNNDEVIHEDQISLELNDLQWI